MAGTKVPAIILSLHPHRPVLCFLFHAIFEKRYFRQAPQQQRAQAVAGDQLAQGHRGGVEGEGHAEGAGKAHLLPGQHPAHQYPIAHHRRQRGQPPVFAPGGKKGRQESGQGAHDDVQQTVGAEKVGDEAARK